MGVIRVTRKRAAKLLMSVTTGGERVYVGKLMDLDRYKGKTNKEKLVNILWDLSAYCEAIGDREAAWRSETILMNVR